MSGPLPLAIGEWHNIAALRDANVVLAVCELGIKGSLSAKQAIETAWKFCHVLDNRGTMKICISLGGFDDDPAELWNIPEARDFLHGFTFAVESFGHPRETWGLLPESVGLIAMCTGRGRAIRKDDGSGYNIEITEQP